MRPKGGWKSVTDVEIAVAEYVDWFNHRRLHGEIGLVPPADLEANHWATTESERYVAHLSRPGLVPSNRASTKPGAIQAAGMTWFRFLEQLPWPSLTQAARAA